MSTTFEVLFLVGLGFLAFAVDRVATAINLHTQARIKIHNAVIKQKGQE